MKILKKVTFAAVILLLGMTMISNQAVAQAGLNGTVVDDSTQQAISDVEVQIEAIDESATTDSEGKFNFENLQPGTHTVTVNKEGYKNWSREVEIIDEPKELNINLKKEKEGQEAEPSRSSR